MPLFGHEKGSSEPPAVGSVDPPAGVDEVSAALEHFAGLPLPERAAEVLAEIGPAIAAAWTSVDWSGWELPKGTDIYTLLEPLVPRAGYKGISSEQRAELRMKVASLRVTLAEAFQALVLARMLIRQDPSGSLYSEAAYANSPDGLAALERGDVASVVARRLTA